MDKPGIDAGFTTSPLRPYTTVTEYDVEPPPDRLDYRVQLRKAFSTDSSDVTRFVVQLEYWLDGDYREVVRYDHDSGPDAGHDVTEEGLHRDVYRDGEKLLRRASDWTASVEQGVHLRRRQLVRERRTIRYEIQKMARSKRYDDAVSGEDYDQIREGISESFDDLYERLADELGGEPEEYRQDPEEMDEWTDGEG